MRSLIIILVALLLTLPALAEETQQELKVSEWAPEQSYVVGQQMAECAAFFRFIADLPNVMGVASYRRTGRE